MELGDYYYKNCQKIEKLHEDDWKIAIKKCKDHLRWKLRQKTLSGVHTASNLGEGPIDYYLNIAYEKILSGHWEWKEQFDLSQQMIRIADSYISKEIEKSKSAKNEEFQIIYEDIETAFYADFADDMDSETWNLEVDRRLKQVEQAVAGDDELEIMIEGLKEGKKRAEIASILDMTPRQFDKLKEKLIRRMTNLKSTST